MKLVFVSNFFNHHQKPFCEELYRILGDEFSFVSTCAMGADRIKLGYSYKDTPRYVRLAYKSQKDYAKALELVNAADAVIAGEAPKEFFTERLRMGKLVLRYAERPFKIKPSFARRMYHAVRFRMRDGGSRNVFMLCASAYAAADFASVGMYKNRMYKWGYFPAVKEYDSDKLLAEKKRNTILWCGRFIDWKHPDDAIRLAARLKKAGCEFQLNMIGTGDMEAELKYLAEACGVADVVHFLGAMPPERVRIHMEEAGIYLFTSDRQEGWGAVLNEAMSSCCAVVASEAAGATPYLIQDGNNGLIYQSGNLEMLYKKVLQMLSKPTEQALYGSAAYRTILDVWNGEVAAGRVLQLAEGLLRKENCTSLFTEGPCSPAV